MVHVYPYPWDLPCLLGSKNDVITIDGGYILKPVGLLWIGGYILKPIGITMEMPLLG